MLETFVREAFIKKEHVVSVFFLSTCKYEVINDLNYFGNKGRLSFFLFQSCLYERHFKFCVLKSFSYPNEQESGVIQGCILPVILFGVKI